MENYKISDDSYSNRRGKSALDIEHKDIAKEDELLINLKISKLYEVDLDEAQEVHINYHANRLISMLNTMSKKNGMKDIIFNKKLEYLNLEEIAIQISKGIIYERVGLDILFKELCKIEKGESSDRYINFYG